jgi:glycosyltransferase involved in cell wall biosynthesis
MTINIKISVVFHGLDLILLNEKRPSLIDEICEYANLIVFNSNATRELFEQIQSFYPEKSYILYPGINPTQLESVESASTATLEKQYDINLKGKTIVLSLARLVKRKGIDISLRALAPILDSSNQYHYVIAGDGPEYDALKTEVERRGLGDKVTLTGWVTDAEKYGLLKASTLFVMPNHTRGGDDFEGFGISFIEASYFENVVVGGRSGGAEEAISEGESGYLLDFEQEGADEKLRALLNRLLANPNQTEKLAKRGRAYILERFQAPELVAKFAESYNDMVRCKCFGDCPF